jgi:predicted RNA binding protein YcfA (HicA-like mRNA interferase family)
MARRLTGDLLCIYIHKTVWAVMKSYSSRDLIKMLKADGWQLRSVDGSHHNFRHPSKPGRVTITHPRKDIPFGTLRSIFDQAGWDWKER